MTGRYVGRRIKRTEDRRLVEGAGQYVDDIELPGTLHVCFLRSIHAHARVARLDVAGAAAAPGVVAVFTGADVASEIGPVRSSFTMPGLRVTEHRALATDRVYYVGHAVAAVVATDRYIARDAVESIEIEYDELPAVVDPETAAGDEHLVHDAFGTNVAYELPIGSGDLDAAFEKADWVVRQRIAIPRVAPVAMEGRGVLARYRPAGRELTLWSSTQIPHMLRTRIAEMLRIPEHRMRVVAPDVGGGFGGKVNIFAEEALVGWMAMQLGRPVKWIESRRENIQTTPHGRGQSGVVSIGCSHDGRITGLRYDLVVDLGAYCQSYTPVMAMTTAMMLSGCYDIPAVQTNITGVFTNKVPTDSYRGAGGPEATYAVERAIDMAASELGVDPVELRRKNFIRPDDFPHQTATGVVYDCGDYDAALGRALAMVGYDEWRAEQRRGRERGRLLGIGVSTYAELCGVGPSRGSPTGFGAWESATVRVEPTGTVTVLTGISPQGQGSETAFAQITADALGIDLDDVTVLHGDTRLVQYGIGTFGSRATAVGGAALAGALEKVTAKAARLAALMLGVDVGRVTFTGGRFLCGETDERGRTVPARPPSSEPRSVTFKEVAMAAYVASDLPCGMEPGLVETCAFDPQNFTATFGAHVAVVEVDRETGEIAFHRYVGVDDCGRVINPLMVDGQVHGGIAQSIGQALYERIYYDDEGQLVTGTLMDYAVPRASQMPRFELDRTETPSPVNPLGAKGVGEAGTIGGLSAVVNAVVDALAPFGVRHLDVPLTPETVWRAMHHSLEV